MWGIFSNDQQVDDYAGLVSYLSKNLVALSKAAVHVLLLLWWRHDVVGLPQSSSGIHQLQRVVVWRRNDAALGKARESDAHARCSKLRSQVCALVMYGAKKSNKNLDRYVCGSF